VAEIGAIRARARADAAGKPVADARVVVKEPPQPAEQAGQMRRTMRVGDAEDGDVHVFGGDEPLGSGTTDAEGNAVIAGLPAGPAAVAASHARLAESAPATVALPSSGDVEVKLVLREPGFADVAVTKVDGAPAPATVVVQRAARRRRGSRAQREGGADGRVRIGPLPAGDYRAELQLDAHPRSVGGAMLFVGGEQRALRGTSAASASTPARARRSPCACRC